MINNYTKLSVQQWHTYRCERALTRTLYKRGIGLKRPLRLETKAGIAKPTAKFYHQTHKKSPMIKTAKASTTITSETEKSRMPCIKLQKTSEPTISSVSSQAPSPSPIVLSQNPTPGNQVTTSHKEPQIPSINTATSKPPKGKHHQPNPA